MHGIGTGPVFPTATACGQPHPHYRYSAITQHPLRGAALSGMWGCCTPSVFYPLLRLVWPHCIFHPPRAARATQHPQKSNPRVLLSPTTMAPGSW